MAEATDVDVERRQVPLGGGERLDYDSLIDACGARTSYLGLPNRVYGGFEKAERARDRESRDEYLTFAVVGGGATLAWRWPERSRSSPMTCQSAASRESTLPGRA
jgi:NADH dehydrogenase